MVEIDLARLRVLLDKPLRSAEEVRARIGPRRVRAVLDLDDFAVLRLDERRVHLPDEIGADELLVVLSALFEILLEDLPAREVGGLNRGQDCLLYTSCTSAAGYA